MKDIIAMAQPDEVLTARERDIEFSNAITELLDLTKQGADKMARYSHVRNYMAKLYAAAHSARADQRKKDAALCKAHLAGWFDQVDGQGLIDSIMSAKS